MPTMRSIATLLVMLLGTGCSYAFVQAPPPRSVAVAPGQPPPAFVDNLTLATTPVRVRCTESTAAPLADGVFAAIGWLAVIGAVGVFVADANEGGEMGGLASAFIGLPMAGAGLGIGIVSTLSAIWGFDATSRCAGRRSRDGFPRGWGATGERSRAPAHLMTPVLALREIERVP